MEEVVIAGMSGKLPESDNMEEFWANLIGSVDMVTDDDRRWKAGELVALGLSPHTGRPWPVLAVEAASQLPRHRHSSLSPPRLQSHQAPVRHRGLGAQGRRGASTGHR